MSEYTRVGNPIVAEAPFLLVFLVSVLAIDGQPGPLATGQTPPLCHPTRLNYEPIPTTQRHNERMTNVAF